MTCTIECSKYFKSACYIGLDVLSAMFTQMCFYCEYELLLYHLVVVFDELSRYNSQLRTRALPWTDIQNGEAQDCVADICIGQGCAHRYASIICGLTLVGSGRVLLSSSGRVLLGSNGYTI